jgi:ferredoxin-NADP reductase
VARAAVHRRLTWQAATLAARRAETPSASTLSFAVPDWPDHLAGQHVDVRLTAEDGYVAQRGYSIASPPGSPTVDLTVERLAGGEVSPFLVDELAEGDAIELRGPVGGYFVWSADRAEPLQLIAGGSGIVPLMCMLRHRAAAGGRAPARLLLSARTVDDVIYRAELDRLAAETGVGVDITLTRAAPEDWTGRRGRIDAGHLADVAFAPGQGPAVFVCGPTPFVEAVANALLELGHAPEHVKTERFGPTGG